MSYLVIGLSGKIGSGKDTAGTAIRGAAERAGWQVLRRGLGDALKEEVASFLSQHDPQHVLSFLKAQVRDEEQLEKILRETFYFNAANYHVHRELRIPVRRLAGLGTARVYDYRGHYAVVLTATHDRFFKECFRELLKWWGTEYRRGNFGATYWTDRLRIWIDQHFQDGANILVYVPDVRFPNEAFLIQEDLGGYLIRVERPGAGKGHDHPSDTALDDYRGFNATIHNTKTLKDLMQAGTMTFYSAVAWKEGPKGASTAPQKRKG